MKFNYIMEFINLAEGLNYSKSADRLFMSQPVLSRHMQSMEEELGIKLFERSTHGVKLTAAGVIAYEELSSIAERYDAFLEKLSLNKKGLLGNLNFGILYYAINDYLDDITMEIERICPSTNLSIHSYQPPGLGQDLLSRKIDLGLTHHVSLPEDPSLRTLNLHNEQMAVIFPDTHRFCGRKKVSVHELDKETFVFMTNEKWHEPYVRSLLARYLPGEIKVVYTEQIDTVRSTVLSEDAIAILAEHVTNVGLKGIESAMFVEDDMQIMIVLAYMEGNENPALAAFLKEQKITMP